MARKKPVCPQMAFFIVTHGIPTVSLGFSNEQSVLFGGILSAINSLTESETGLGQLDDIQAKDGRIYIQKQGDALVGFFVWSKSSFPQSINRQMKVLAGALGTRYLADYVFNPVFDETLMVGALPDRYQHILSYQSVFGWRKRESPFRLTDTLEKHLEKIDHSILDHLSVADLTFPERIENSIDEAVWAALGAALKDDVSTLLTARNIDHLILNLRVRVKTLLKEVIQSRGPVALLRSALEGKTFDWSKNSIKQATAGKLLHEFVEGYTEDQDPFGLQGLVIAKQLLDLAFPNQHLEKIVSDKDFVTLLTESANQIKIRKQPEFVAVTKFLMETPLKKLKKLSSKQLKEQITGILEVEDVLPNLEIGTAAYDLSGNPESASLARNSLEGALISITAELLAYLLVEDENQAGKLFLDLDRNTRILANQTQEIYPFITCISQLLGFPWQNVTLAGILPTTNEMGTEDVCKYFNEDPKRYISQIKDNSQSQLEAEFKDPMLSLIQKCQDLAENNNSGFPIEEYKDDFPLFSKHHTKIMRDLKKIQSRVRANKKINPKEFKNITDRIVKEYSRTEQQIQKEFQNFQKRLEPLLVQRPPWFKFQKDGAKWELVSPNFVLGELNTLLSMDLVTQKKSKTLKQAIEIFKKMGGIPFVWENIVSNFFYERVPTRLQKLVETPAKRQRIKELKILQEKRFNDGLDAVSDFLIQNSEEIVSHLFTQALALLKESFLTKNPEIMINDEDIINPCYISLVDVPKDVLDEKPPELVFGKGNHFIYATGSGNFVNLGYHLSSFNGRGDDLFGFLVSSASLENGKLYSEVTKILGNFSGYVTLRAIGNMRICPPAMKVVNDLFM